MSAKKKIDVPAKKAFTLKNDAASLEKSFKYNLEFTMGKDINLATSHDNFMALAYAVRDRLTERWISTQRRYHNENGKRVYYLSLEFLIGRLLGNNVINLCAYDETRAALKDLGIDIEDIRDNEVDAGLGNGGLGRLAACFLDSMATLGIPAHGYGIRYDFGIFNQRIVNGQQVEQPDEWLKRGNPWEIQRAEYAVNVRYYGKTYTYHDKAGKLHVQWVDTDNVQAVPFDVPVPGYANDVVNTLRLWSARSSEEFDFEYFNHGDYQKAVESKMNWETISKVLYPNDEKAQGQELRLKQEYFFTAASLSDIVRRYKDGNPDMSKLHEKVAIQLNDTHPAVAVVEFMRILIDDEELDWDTAWNVTTKTFAYTNHTVLPEALEKWELNLFGKLLPRHLEIIYEINHRFLREVADAFPGDLGRMSRMSIIEEAGCKFIRMANLAIIGSHSVNGVSALHSQLLKDALFKDFYQLWPDKFNNKTNGITQRRWLLKANKRQSKLITETIGNEWVRDLDQLKRLAVKKDDPAFQKQWQAIKRVNKEDFAAYVKKTNGIVLNPDSMFDVQIKRIHEYKRQMLFAFYVLREYLKLKNDPKSFIHPRTFVFGGKAAPGYRMAKQIIRFINSVAYVINHDRTIGDKIKVVFLENYRVSLAEKVFPASDLSEQISTAGYEASGTGCMKFMLNGALTIGTHDGANIEMGEEVGHENFYFFGLKAEDVEAQKRAGYSPQSYINRNFYLQEIFRLIDLNFFSPLETGIFRDLADNLRYKDTYLIAADFEDYCRVQDIASEEYKNTKLWTRKSILNVAASGKFSSDRTIAEYAKEIWGVKTK